MKNNPIKQYREKRGITQTELGSLLGVHQSLISAIEAGRRNVSPEKALDWSGILNIPKSVLCPRIFGDRS